MTPNTAALWGLATLLVLAALGVLVRHAKHGGAIIYAACALASGINASAAATALLTISPTGFSLISLPIGLPLGHTLLGFDSLSAIFSIIINGVAAIVSIYAIGYGAHEAQPQRVLPFYPAFLAGMNLVLLANDAFSFLVGWEFMSLSSWALVVSNDRDPANRNAGYLYLVMALCGTLTLLLAFGLLAGSSGGYSFAEMRQALPSAHIGIAVLLLGLAGAGSKAGLFPMHGWLPLAHPAAPSHVSALMSGVMTKVAVYGFIRLTFDLAQAGEAGRWLGALLIGLGAITAVYGVLAALFDTDIKRVLAYSTIENIGIIFGALGLAIALRADNYPMLAALALTAALLHVANHALFKSLLFMGAGAIVHATGARNLDAFGGLASRMPWTMGSFLVGSAAIAALPPLNGFVSEWLLFQSVLSIARVPDWLLKMLVPAAGAGFALAAALAAACFIRVFGITFLGRARSTGAATAHDADRYSLSAMCLVAAGCVLFGILPLLAIEPLQRAVLFCLNTRLQDQTTTPWLSLVPLSNSGSSYNGITIFVFLIISSVLAALVLRFAASGALRRGPTWDCGTPDPRSITQYSAESFAQPLKRVFGTTLFAAREAVIMPKPGDTQAARAQVHWRDLPWELLYLPIARAVLWISGKANALQFLTIRSYLMLVFCALLTLLTIVAIWH